MHGLLFNPRATLHSVPLHDGHECLVVDDALLDPQAWRDWAVARRAQFARPPYVYPGVELALPAAAVAQAGEFFAAHIRARLGGRRTLDVAARLSLATLQPHELAARQWFCHRDSARLAPGQCIVAAVLYLFDDTTLGGTSIYRPRRSADETARLVHECSTLNDAEFAARHPEITPGYMTEGNAWFERVASLPARFNRAVFYDGNLFHGADLRAPEKLSADPATGRLTLNGFFTCRRTAA